MRGDPPPDMRGHATLLKPENLLQSSRFPEEFWEAWNYLLDEAIAYDFSRMQNRLMQLLESSYSVEGYGTEKIVEALKGELPPRPPPAAAFLTAGGFSGQEAETQEKPKTRREKMLERLRGI